MATMQVRYLIRRDGPEGGPPRWFWQPSSELREQGFRPCRVPDNWRDLADPVQLEAAAIACAQARNAELDRWRAGKTASAPAKPAAAGERTVNALIAEFLASDDFTSKRPATREWYRQILKTVEAWCGEAPVAAMTTERFTVFYKALRTQKPALAHAVMRVARLLFAYARRNGWRRDNPATELALVGLEKSGRLWPRDAVAAFVAMADRMDRHSIGTAVFVNHWLGQRQADVLALPRRLLDPRGYVLRQRKTGAGVPLPIAAVPPLVARIEAELARQAARGHAGTMLLLCETTGKRWSEDQFRREFNRVRAALAAETPRFEVDYLPAGVDADSPDAFTIATAELQFMHLRHTAIVRHKEAGSDIADIAALSGHSLVTVNQVIEHYLVRTGTMVASVLERRLARENAGFRGRLMSNK
jgi:hypothetical protein